MFVGVGPIFHKRWFRYDRQTIMNKLIRKDRKMNQESEAQNREPEAQKGAQKHARSPGFGHGRYP